MLREIREQPGVLARTAEAARDFVRDAGLAVPEGGRVILAGCGDMDFSARAAAGLARLARPEASGSIRACNSMEMRWEDASLTDRDLVIVASFSGMTPRSVEALLRARSRGARVVAVTGNPQSKLAEKAHEILFLPTGPVEELGRHAYGGYHANVPQTKTYTAALMAELHLAGSLLQLDDEWRADLDGVSALMERLLGPLVGLINEWITHDCMRGEDIVDFSCLQDVAVLGSGPWRPAAAYGAAKLLEMTIPSRHQCIEEFNHLELFLTAQSLVVFLCPDAASWSRAQELTAPYEKLGSRRLALTALGADSPALRLSKGGNDRLDIPGRGAAQRFFACAAALQIIAAGIGLEWGRDIDQWVGGKRTKLIEDLSQITIRSSRIRTDDLSDPAAE
jgi:fructoselysine-6-P-deglycase FrlB-like protein